MLFIDRLIALLDENSFNVLKLKGCFDKLEIIQELCNKKNLKLELSRYKYFTFSSRLNGLPFFRDNCVFFDNLSTRQRNKKSLYDHYYRTTKAAKLKMLSNA